MNRETAIRMLKKILGTRAAWRIDPSAPDADERGRLSDELETAQAELDHVKTAREARLAVLLADPEYQSLRANEKDLNAKCNKLRGGALRYKITVGELSGPGFLVCAQGDTWGEVFASLKGERE